MRAHVLTPGWGCGSELQALRAAVVADIGAPRRAVAATAAVVECAVFGARGRLRRPLAMPTLWGPRMSTTPRLAFRRRRRRHLAVSAEGDSARSVCMFPHHRRRRRRRRTGRKVSAPPLVELLDAGLEGLAFALDLVSAEFDRAGFASASLDEDSPKRLFLVVAPLASHASQRAMRGLLS